MSHKKSLPYALNATCRDFSGIFLLFCMAVCYTRLLSLGMAVCDYASLLTLIQPIQNATFFGEKRRKNYFCDNGGFKILFRPFSTSIFKTRCAIPAFQGPLRESWAPFQVDFFGTEYCLCSRCIIQKWVDKCN
jgi:hypothetical protein